MKDDLPPGITRRNGACRLRVHHEGRMVADLSGLDEETARAALALVRQECGRDTPDTIQHQIDNIKPGTSLKGIHRVDKGLSVNLFRQGRNRHGGYFTGPDALTRAIKCRDRLNLEYPRAKRRK